MRHHPTSGGASVAQNSLLHHHRAPTPWGGGAEHRHYPPRRWRTDGAMAQGCPTCLTPAKPQVMRQREERAFAEKPERGVQRLRHRPPCFPCAAGGSAVALDSLEAAVRCLTAWPRSSASTGFPEAHRLHPSSHGIPMVALAPLPERIIESHQAGHGYRRAVTQTVGHVRKVLHGAACSSAARARIEGVVDAISEPAPGDRRGQNRSSIGPLLHRARIISARYPEAKLKISPKIFRKNRPRCRNRRKLIAADGCRDE